VELDGEEDLVQAATALREDRAKTVARPPCVLVVDDDPGVRLLCTTTLRLEGYEAIEAATGPEGFERAVAETPDLALLDVELPGLDGFGLAAALLRNERTQRLPLVFLTADTDPGIEALAYEAGAVGFFAKPLDPEGVGLFVNRALAHLVPAQISSSRERPSAGR
jgi:CheY-like chemotaxis protein